ncbi:MAG: NAD(P)-dependent oxidoreductase [Myxococcota bacterium]
MNDGAPIAVLGLGAMGSRMAQNLLADGLPVRVWNRSEGATKPLADAGASVARTPREAAEGAAIVLACVRDDDAARAVWLHPETGAAAGLAEGTLAIESSTLTPGAVRELAGALAPARFVEAPVVGSRPQAEQRALVHLVGASEADFDAAKPLLARLGKAAQHVGAPGQGAVMKLVVNAYFATQTAAMGELLGFAAKAGVGAERAAEILGALPITSPALKGLAGLMVKGAYAPLFPVELVAKDLRYAEAAAVAVGATLPTAGGARAAFEAAIDAGDGGLNIQGVAKQFLG